jgi:hypothetical protein
MLRLARVLAVGSLLIAPSGFVPGDGEGDCGGALCGGVGACVRSRF